MIRLFLFFLIPLFVFGSISDCSCDGTWSLTDTSEYENSVQDDGAADEWRAKFPREVCSNESNPPWFSHTDIINERSDGGYVYFTYSEKTYTCAKCTDPDVPLNLDTNETIAFPVMGDDPDNVCGASPTKEEQNQCSDLHGRFGFERDHCCDLSFCIVSDGNNTDPQCDPGWVPSPDHPEICIHDPNGQCPVDREMCICGGDSENDQCKYSTHDCIGWRSYDVPSCSTPTCDTGLIDTSGHCCEPGQILCHGQCQLSGVPCNPDQNDSNPPDPDGGDGDNSDDPCSYPLRSTNNLPKQGVASSIEDCVEDGRVFGQVDCNNNPVAVDFIKNDGCVWGGCYYTSWMSPPKNCQDNNNPGGSDGNSTGGSGSSGGSDSNSSDGNSSLDSNGSNLDINGVKDRLDKINDQVKKQGGRLNTALQQLDTTTKGVKTQVKASGDQISSTLDSLNKSIGRKLDNIDGSLSGAKQTLGSKLDDLKNAINDKNLSVVVENNISIDLNRTNTLLADINRSLQGPIIKGKDLRPYNDALANSENIFNNALASFDSLKNDIAAIANGSPPTVSYSGDPTISGTAFNHDFTIDISFLSRLRPFFQFILNSILVLFSIKLYIFIARDIAKYISGGS